jgi:hypothetical protein
MKPMVPLRQALADPQLLGGMLAGDSWDGWRTLLIAAMGEALTDTEREMFAKLTGHAREPLQRIEELVAVVGRRGGKSRASAVLATFIGGLCEHPLAPGERGVLLCIAPDQRQAKITLEYCAASFDVSPVLRQLVVNRTADTLELANNISVEVRSASFRRLRGPTYIGVILDEGAYLFSEDWSANTDVEIVSAVKPGLATTGGPLIIASSPYARRGVLWETYKRHYGADGDPRILVAQGASRDFNPSLPKSVVDRALERDPAAAAAEYLGEFRSDIESFISIEAVTACVSGSVLERQPQSSWRYTGFVDPSGGAGDSFTLGISHKEHGIAVLDLVREVKPPFSPEGVVKEFSYTLRRYRITKVTGDRYAGEWPREQFRKQGVAYHTSERAKSEIYIELLAAINSRVVDLLDHPRLIAQLTGLERRTSRGGRDSIDHPPNAHDDVANAVAGAIVLASAVRGDGKAKVERVPLPAFDSYYNRRGLSDPINPGTSWMAGPRRW